MVGSVSVCVCLVAFRGSRKMRVYPRTDRVGSIPRGGKERQEANEDDILAPVVPFVVGKASFFERKKAGWWVLAWFMKSAEDDGR